VNVCGTSLWILKGHEQDREAVADFRNFLSSARVQAQWHQETAYLPVTHEAFALTLQSGFYRTHPAAFIGVAQVTRFPRDLPNGLRIKDYGETRERIVAMLTRIFAEQKPVRSQVHALLKEEGSK